MEMRPSLPIITPPRASAWSLLASTHLATTCKNSCRSPAGIVDADQTNKLVTRLTPGEKSNRKRMAQVATVYSIAPFPRTASDVLHTLRNADEVSTKRPRPTDKRVWASVDKGMAAVIREAFDEALRRDPDKERRWVVLVDGDPKQVRAVKAEARRVGVKVTLIADIVHVIEYIWDAARALFGGSNSKAER